MKKVVLFLLLVMCPSLVEALDYSVENFYVDAQISSEGDVLVSELIVLDGDFNGYIRDIIYGNSFASTDLYDPSGSYIYNAESISNVMISAKYVDDVSFNTFSDEDFDLFSYEYNADNGDVAVYEKSNLSKGYSFKMYYPANNQKVAFLIEYVIDDVVVIHEDVAEFYWNFVGDAFDDPIRDIQIKVSLPGSDKTDDFRIWAHGGVNALSGEINFDSSSSFTASIKGNVANEPVDIRTTFSKSLITNTSMLDHSNEFALDAIIQVETTRADEANKLRSELSLKYNIVAFSSYIIIFGVVAAAIYVYKKYDKERTCSYYSKYNRDFIEDYDVEVISYLMSKNITNDAFSATILNMIYKKNIKSEKDASSKKEDFILTFDNSDNLSESEKIVTDLLFEKIGTNNTVKLSEVKKYASSTKTAPTFLSSLDSWKVNVKRIAEEQQFFESNGSVIFGIIFLVFGGFLFWFSGILEVESFMPTVSLALVIIFFVYTLYVTKKTEKGILHYKKWKAFKNFLSDFGTFEEKTLPEIILWERYLVYATVFGLADKLEKTMKIKAANVTDVNDTFLINTFMLNSMINRSVVSTISTSAAKATSAVASSSSSSGGGFGGGFSGGGGFGGGGGGGRGF